MKERPILFSAPTVRALLDCTKSQTRRALREQPPEWVKDFCTYHNPKGEGLAHFAFDPKETELRDWYAVCPYGQPGDRLWVREAWATHKCFNDTPPRDLTTRSIHYQADGQIETGKNRPSIHMPRWASRILLEVVSVRVERLHAISMADAQAEGARFYEEDRDPPPPEADWDWDYRQLFTELWCSINGAESWEASPWVWVVEFKRVTP